MSNIFRGTAREMLEDMKTGEFYEDGNAMYDIHKYTAYEDVKGVHQIEAGVLIKANTGKKVPWISGLEFDNE